MKPEYYWSQQQLYFFAVCALFPERLLNTTLNMALMNEYIADFFDTDLQVKLLTNLQSQGMLEFSMVNDPNDSKIFLISSINKSSFRNQLTEYLRKFRNDELIATPPSKPESFEDLQKRLHLYLTRTDRDNPVINISNIWDSWHGYDIFIYPFWEVILSSDLIVGETHVLEIGVIPAETGFIGRPEMPYAKIEVLNKVPSSSGESDENEVTRLQAQIKINRTTRDKVSVSIDLENGENIMIKDSLKTDMAPIALLSYLINHPGRLVDLEYARTRIEGCGDTKNLSEVLRQCELDEMLKRALFDKSSKSAVQLKKDATLTSSEIALLRRKFDRSASE